MAKDKVRKRRQIIGGVVAVLVIVGIVSVFRGLVGLGVKLFDDTDEKKNYESRLTYLVMLDVLPFDSLEHANQNALLESCIWAALFNEDTSLYSTDEYGEILLPSVDVDLYASKLFGPDYKLTHNTFTADGLTFAYDETTKCYTIPVTGQVGNYAPKVMRISGTNKVKRVTVGYLAPVSSGNAYSFATGTGYADEPVKYYDFIFTRTGGEYYLTSMEESEMKVAASSGSGSSESVPQSSYGDVYDPNSTVDEALDITNSEAVQSEIDAAAKASSSETAAASDSASSSAAG